MSEEDLLTWARMAGRRGLRTWLSATPTNRTKKRHRTTLKPWPGRDIRALFEMFDSEMLRSDVGQVDH